MTRLSQYRLQLGITVVAVLVLMFLDKSHPVFWFSNLFLVLSIYFLNGARKYWKKDYFNLVFYADVLVIYTLHPTVIAVFMLLLLMLMSFISYRPKNIHPRRIAEQNYLLYLIPSVILLRTALFLTSNEHSYLGAEDISPLGYAVIMLTPLQVIFSWSRSVNNFSYSYLRQKRSEGRNRMILSVMDMYSHSLRTPISTIYYKSMADSMRATKEGGEPSESTAIISKESQYLVDLLDQLTETFHEVLQDKEQDEPKESLENILRTYVTDQVHLNAVPNVLLTSSEKALLMMTLNSLIKNSLHYEATQIQLSCYIQPEEYRIIVSDNGVGMSKKQLQLYGTAASGNSLRNSTGLGVFFLKQILDIFDWTITAQSEEGVGTRVNITIPR